MNSGNRGAGSGSRQRGSASGSLRLAAALLLLAPAMPSQQKLPEMAFVGLHGGVFPHLKRAAAGLARVSLLTDEEIVHGALDLARYRLVFVQHVHAGVGEALAELLVKERGRNPAQRAFSMRGAVQLTARPEHAGLLEQDPELARYYGSSEVNLRRLIVYALVRWCGAQYEIEPPEPSPHPAFYHPDHPELMDAAEALAFLRGRGGDVATRPRVAVTVHDIHLQFQQPKVVDALLRAFDEAGLTALAILDTSEGLQHLERQYVDLLKAFGPEAIVHTCHSRDPLALREELDVPHLHSIFFREKSIDDWYASPDGLGPNEITFQIATQEALGAIEPQVGAGTRLGGGSAEELLPIPERIDHIVRRTAAWVRLRREPNAQKKVAVVYWDSGLDKRGLMRGTATGMHLNAPRSLVKLLGRMAAEGYTVTDPPADEDELLDQLLARGRQLLPQDRDELDRLVATGSPALIPLAEYEAWLQQVPKAARDELIERWGPPPGDFMVWHDRSGAAFFVVPRIAYGNVVLLPQPLRGEALDSSAIHDRFTAPPHHYVATYLWLQKRLRADAVLHFGTHGSEIWLPGKGTGLCDRDWCDLLIGAMPDVYTWTVDNLGEAPMAKRRTYAVLVGHQPPPVVNAGLDEDLQTLRDELEKWATLGEGALKERFAARLSDSIRAQGLDHDLQLESDPTQPFDAAALQRVEDHLHAIFEEKVPVSLHTLGEPPADDVLVPHLVTCLRRAFLDHLAALLPNGAAGHTGSLRTAAEVVVGAAIRDGLDDAAALERAGVTLPGGKVPEAIAADLRTARGLARGYAESGRELRGLMEALAGRFVTPGPGRGPDRNPGVLPTGRNLFLLNAEEVPSRASFDLGRDLAEQLLDGYRKRHGRLPAKVGFSLSSHATFQDYGVMESEILWLLGVEPLWDERNRVQDFRVVPRAELGRPRVDVFIATNARYDDNLSSRLHLIDRAIRAVAECDEADNAIRSDTAAAATALRQRGLAGDEADRLAVARIYGYASGRPGSAKYSYFAERSADWDTRDELVEVYLKQASHVYTDGAWGEPARAAYETAMQGTEVVLRTWYRSTSSPLSNRYDWLNGGTLALAVEHVTGHRPEYLLTDVRDPDAAGHIAAEEALRRDFRVRLFNRKWIEGMQKEGYAGADQVAVHVGNAFGWEAVRQGSVPPETWTRVKEVYLDDALDLGMDRWFERENPHAQQDVAATLLDAIRKGFWHASAETTAEIAKRYLDSVRRHGDSGGLRDAGSGKIAAFATEQLAGRAAPAPEPEPELAAARPSEAVASASPEPEPSDAISAPAPPEPVPEQSPADRPPTETPAAPGQTVRGHRLEPVPRAAEPAVPVSLWPYALAIAVLLFVLGFARRPFA